MEFLGIRLIGVNAETGRKLLLTIAVVLAVLLLRRAAVALVAAITGQHRNDRIVFWTRQGSSLATAALTLVAVLSIWFDDPQRLTAGLGFFSAGLAFALQRVVTTFAGYLVIMRGNTFTVGDRITMGGVRGDVISLSFMQTKIMEMGQPPSVQSAEPPMWVRSRQFTGRIVTVTNDKVFDEPVYNYTREFPFIWEELVVPIHYGADHARAEAILLECVGAHTKRLEAESEPVRMALQRRYIISLDELTPRAFYRMTDNWVELSVRFIVGEHGVREVKDAITRDVLRRFQQAGLEVASATYEITAVAPLRVEGVTLQAAAAKAGSAATS